MGEGTFAEKRVRKAISGLDFLRVSEGACDRPYFESVSKNRLQSNRPPLNNST
jgi:hypothetical protein